jgi:hypothetical protein
MTISALFDRCACSNIMPLAARCCTSCAHDRVAMRMWWSEFLISWKYLGRWCVLNAQGVFAISQQAFKNTVHDRGVKDV